MTAPHEAQAGAVRAALLRQIERLEAASTTGEAWQRNLAAGKLGTAQRYLKQLDLTPADAGFFAGMIGPNGGPLSSYAVDDACQHVETVRFTERDPSGFYKDAA